MLDAERGAAHANITGFGDSLWWAATTITTVGYRDRYRVTTQGRLVAVVPMRGIALLSVRTAGLAAWFVRQPSEASRWRRLVVGGRSALSGTPCGRAQRRVEGGCRVGVEGLALPGRWQPQ